MKDANDAYHAGADYLGMVLHPLSKRCIESEKALEIIHAVPNANFVLVFGYDEEDFIVSAHEIFRNTSVKFQIPAEHKWFDSIIQKIGVENIIPAISVKEEIKPDFISKFKKFQFVIFDSAGIKIDEKTVVPGGTGKTFDWNYLKNIEIPYLIAGGINCENVEEALEKLNPLGVDTASGVEKSPGIKDTEKMLKFIKIVKTKTRT